MAYPQMIAPTFTRKKLGPPSLHPLESQVVVRPPTAIAIAVIEQGQQLLIGPRPDNLPLGGRWEFPGGKVEPGETPPEAAVRECLEETGLAIEVSHVLGRHRHEYEHDHVDLYFYACRTVDASAQPKAPFQWVPRMQLAEYRFPEANREIVLQLLAKA